MSHVFGKITAQPPAAAQEGKLVLIKFIWLPLYLLAAIIHHFAYGDPALESLVTVLPAFIVGLIPVMLVFCH